MAMIEVPRTDRELVNLPTVRTYRDNPGERWGAVAEAAGRGFGGIADGLGALGRAIDVKLKMREAERENEASLLASRYRAHSRNGWNGYMTRDDAGNEVRVAGARDKSYADYADGESTLSDIEGIDASFREREDYRKMDAETRKIFERKILPCRDEMMQLAQQKAYADRLAKGKAEFDERVQEWGQEVETTFGGDDSAYAGASEQCSVREAVATFGKGEVANAAELDGMQRVSVEDVRFANDPTGAKAGRLRQLVEAKQKVYDRRYFDALCASAAGGRPLGALSPEACAAKAAEFAQGMGETDAERAELAGKAEKARLHLESVRADERAAAVRANTAESLRRQNEFYKARPAPSSVPDFLDGEASEAEKAGDLKTAIEFRNQAENLRARLAKAEKAAADAFASNELRYAEGALALSAAEGRESPERLADRQMRLYMTATRLLGDKRISQDDFDAFQRRMQQLTTSDTAKASAEFYRAFGFTYDTDGDGLVSAGERKAAEKKGGKFYFPGTQGTDDEVRVTMKEFFQFHDAFMSELRAMPPEERRTSAVQELLGRFRQGWYRKVFDGDIARSVAKEMSGIRSDIRARYAASEEVRQAEEARRTMPIVDKRHPANRPQDEDEADDPLSFYGTWNQVKRD